MATIATFFHKFLSFFILLLHLGCFILTTTSRDGDGDGQENHHKRLSKKRRVCPLSQPSHSPHKFKTHKALSSSWTFIKHLFCTKSGKTDNPIQKPPQSTTAFSLTSAISSHQSLVSLTQPESLSPNPPRKKSSGSCSESDISSDAHFFPLRNDIFPCTACGEIFQKPQFLEQHQVIKHAVSELLEGDVGKNVVQIIFKTGWTDTQKCPNIIRILKIHNSSKILSKFEEYRESVKAKAARAGAVKKRDERCIADGNELLRFHCSTFLCDLGVNGDSGICDQQYCNICGIIKSGFSPKLDGISTLSTSYRAHMAIPDEIEEEFKFMNVKRAMLVCRVIAGRVGCDSDEMDKEDGGFDSVVASRGSGVHSRLDEEELLVCDPRAVLPCFVIVYTV